MKTLLETDTLVISHDSFKGNLIADCAFAIARLPWTARNKLNRVKSDSFAVFEQSVKLLGGTVTTQRP